jgi:hypothetical protein
MLVVNAGEGTGRKIRETNRGAERIYREEKGKRQVQRRTVDSEERKHLEGSWREGKNDKNE